MQASSDHPILTTPQGHTLTLVQHEQDLALGQLLMFARTGAARLVPMTSQPSQPGQDAHALPTDVVSAVVAEYARVARIALEKAP
jgi:hypothetical protein